MTAGDNRPSFPDAPERQSTAVRKLLSDTPQTASEIAAGFAGGETVLEAVLAALIEEEKLGRARRTERGWRLEAAPDARARGHHRPMGDWTIEGLVEHHNRHLKPDAGMTERDWSELRAVAYELQFRTRPRAQRLRSDLMRRLALAGRGFPDTSKPGRA